MEQSKRATRMPWAWILLALAITTFGGCSTRDPNALASFKEWALDEATLRAEFQRLNPEADFDQAPVEAKVELADLLLKKALLLRIAEDAVGQPDRKAARLNRVLYEKTLTREYLTARRERFGLTPEQIETEAAKMARKARALVAMVGYDDTEAIRQAMFAGGTYEEVARKFALDKGPKGLGYEEGIISLEREPRAVIRAVFIDDVPPGTVVGPVRTNTGSFFIKVLEYLPYDIANIPGAMERARTIVSDVHYIPFNEAYVESLETAAGIGFHPDSYPVVQEIMQAFWDSINAERDAGNSIEYQAMLAPVWRVPADKADLPVFDLFGKTYTVRDFIRSLDDVDLDYWVTVGPIGKITFQIETRARRLLAIMEAEKTGVTARPSFVEMMTRYREQHLLDQFRDRHLAAQYVPDEAELRAEHQANPNRYLSTNRVAYGLIIFPMAQEAKARALREELRRSEPVRWYELAAETAAADTSVIYFPDTGLVATHEAPPDASWAPFRDAAIAMEAGQLSEVIRTHHGYTIVRTHQRFHPAPQPYEEAKPQVTEYMRQVWLNAEIERLLQEGMKSYGAEVHRERIEALATASSAAS